MLILMDDGRHHAPTRRNIEDAFQRICQYSQSGDVVFVHYSGHGGRVRDTSGDEEDGTLCLSEKTNFEIHHSSL